MEAYISAIIQGLCFSSLALGIFISMRVLNLPDITTDGSFTLGAAVTAVMLAQQIPVYFILPAVCICGAIAGSITGIIHTVLRVHVLLAGIIVMTALYSVNLIVMGRTNIPFDEGFFMSNIFGDSNIWITMTIYVAVLVVIINRLLLSDFGIVLRALGSNSTMLTANGVNTKALTIKGLAISNALTALSGSMIAQHQQFADLNMGIGIVIIGLGSVIIGESLFSFFKSQVLFLKLVAVFFGALVFRVLIAFVLSQDVNPNYLRLITATVVLAVVALSYKKNPAID